MKKVFRLCLGLLLGLIVGSGVFGEGAVYKEGVDTVIHTSCTPPTARTDGTPITEAELDTVEIVFSQNSNMSPEDVKASTQDVYCNHDLPLSSLTASGQWYKSARISDINGLWSDLFPTPVPFMYEKTVEPPTSGTQVPPDSWVVTYVDSEELVNWYMPAVQVFDRDLTTLWHSQYQGAEPPHPHEVQIDMGAVYAVDGFQQQPRSGGGNGTVKDYEFYLSMNGVDWTLAANGTYPPGDQLNTVTFVPQNAQFFRFVALSEQDGGLQTSVAELYVLGTLVPTIAPPNPPILIE